MSYIHSITFAFLPQRWQNKIVIDDNGCWLWQGWNSGDGYGKTCVNGKAMMAHRAVYERVVGQIPEGLVLDHLCRNRPCCNPAHVEPVTTQINTHRGKAVLFGLDMAKPITEEEARAQSWRILKDRILNGPVIEFGAGAFRLEK